MTPPRRILIKAESLHFSFTDQPLFSDFSVAIPAGITWVTGGDGRGKSTLLRMLAGVLAPDSGRLHCNGFTAQDEPTAYSAQVFWTEPRSTAFDQLTAVDYFALQQRHHANFETSVLDHAVSGLGLEPHQHKQLFMLSTGTKRKVWTAAAFASGAPVTLMDEPLAAIDGPSATFVLEWLEQASAHKERAWVIADYTAPKALSLASVIDLGE